MNFNFNFNFKGCHIAKFESDTSEALQSCENLHTFAPGWVGGGEQVCARPPPPHRQANACKICRL